MNLPSSVFTSIPVSQHDIDADIKTERRRLAPLRDAAIHEADLASFQMVGVWAGMVSSIAWVFGNSSEPFLLTPTGELEASCAGFSCPLREWLQTDSATGYFTVTPRHSAASDTDAREPAWEHGGGGLGGFDTQGSSRLSFNQAPLTPSAPFDLWIGHIDHAATISNAYLALSTPLDAGENNRKERLQTLPGSWVLDIDLDAFMPPQFSHRSPPWSYGGQLDGCSRYLYRSLCHRWSTPVGNCTLWQHVDRVFHGSAEASGPALLSAHGDNELSQECRNDIHGLARRWHQLAREDTALGDAGKRLSPAELLLWMQAHGSAAPTALGEGDSATELILEGELAHLPRFLSRLESLLRGLRGSHPHSEKARGGLGPPAAITIARSTDGFAPIETIPYIESLVIGMLDRLYGPAHPRATVAPSNHAEDGGNRNGKPRRAEMVTDGGLRVEYTAETATLTDLRNMVQWLVPPD